MTPHLTWSFETPRRIALHGAGRPVELRYDAVGPDSGWLVLVDGRPRARCADLATAQDRTLSRILPAFTEGELCA